MKKGFLILALLVMALCSFAQPGGKLLTLDEAILKARTTLAPQNLAQLQFYGATNDYVYLKKVDDRDIWMKGNLRNSSDSAFLSLSQLNEKLKGSGFDTVKSMPAIKFSPAGWIMVVNGNKLRYDPLTNRFRLVIPKNIANKENAEESNAGYVAYLENFNLYVTQITDSTKIDPNNGKATVQVTTDGSREIVYASSVHREEFGITKGTFWSNNGRLLAFYRMDQSMVTDYPIINWAERPSKVELIKYPMAGDASHHVTVGVYNTSSHSTTWLKTGEPAEQYLTNIAWSPDDKYIFIAVVNRDQDHMWLKQYDASTGDYIKTLFEEKDERYVQPLVPMLFLKSNPNQFIWQSMRDGWNHLYLYDINGTLIKQLTKGNWEVIDIKGVDMKGENIFYASTEESPVTRNVYSLNLKTGLKKRITTGNLVHGTQLSNDGSGLLDNFSSTSIPRIIRLIDIKTQRSKQLLSAPDPLQSYSKGELSVFPIENRQGTTIYCRLFKPAGFDSTKKYPLIIYWYGGPQVQLIGNNWNGNAADYWFQYMAERGFVVFSIDPRGSDNRGKAFEQSIFRKLGEAQMEDLEDALQWLTKKTYIDKSRMGLFGWSFGGFMTTDYVLNHPGEFKAAVAGGPVMNWQYYEVMYGERYMDKPQENPEGYDATNLIKKAGKLKGKLLLIHGLQDPVVVQEHSVNFVKACIDNGVQVDYMIYPGHEHNVMGKDRVHLFQKITDYFMEHL